MRGMFEELPFPPISFLSNGKPSTDDRHLHFKMIGRVAVTTKVAEITSTKTAMRRMVKYSEIGTRAVR